MTVKPVTRRKRAQKDIEEITDHDFNEGAQSLEVRFIDAIEFAVRHIGEYPARGSPRHAGAVTTPGLRFWRVKRFPYLIFYVERIAQVDVWRVLHAERDIPAWLREPESQ